MQLKDIKQPAIILADEYLHGDIRNQLLEDVEVVENITVLSLQTYLKQFTMKQADAVIYKYYVQLQSLNLKLFKQVTTSKDFIDELIRFVSEMKRYGVSVHELRNNDIYDQELRYIVESVYTIPLNIDYELESINQIQDTSNIYIVDYTQDVFKKRLYEQMIDKGATRVELVKQDVDKKFYYVLNKKEEVEAVARYIIKHDLDVSQCKLTILSQEYSGFIDQIFKRYQIPYYFMYQNYSNRLVFKYCSLFRYYEQPSSENLIRIMEEEVFIHKKMNAFVEYVSIFEKTLEDDFNHIREANISEDILSAYNYNNLVKLEEGANEVKLDIYESLIELHTISKEDVIFYVDELVNQNHVFMDKDDVKVVRKIRKECKAFMPYIDSVSMQLLYDTIEAIQVAQVGKKQGLCITTLDQIIGYKPYHFMIGASSDQYPNFKTLKGLFSESYVEYTSYPSIQERYVVYMRNLEDNLMSSKHIIVFYATASLQGKAKQSALDMDRFMGKTAKYYALPYSTNVYQIPTQLTPKLSEQLFKKDGVYKGSISSFEMFMTCPYKYFIRHGLKIQKPHEYDLDSAKIGTILHYVLENLVSLYHKQYAQQSRQVVEHLIQNKVLELIRVYPQLKDRLFVVQERLVQTMEDNLRVLDKMEEQSSLIPTRCEARFDITFDVKEDKLHLNGFIDRINENNQFFSIIDYKSSPQKLKESDVFTCMKLQLLTYLVAVYKQQDKRPIGAYYYGLANSIQTGIYAKHQRRQNEIEEKDIQDYWDSLLKSKKLEGWTVSENYEVMDRNLQFINGIGIKKDGSYSARTNIYDIQGVEKLLIQIYTNIIEQIKAGDMSITPTDCTYCDYNSICHYKGKMFTRSEIVSEENIYIIKKGKRVDEDEVE